MFTIGDFASLGRVSVRMLRHYDAIGLLRPARVDPFTGYRHYSADQLTRLNRIIALKDLGFTLAQVQQILTEQVDAAQLHGMLRLRRAQLQEQVDRDLLRLARVEARLRVIETEGTMNTEDVVLKSVPPARVARLSAVADGYAPEQITPVISPLFPQLYGRLQAAGVPVECGGLAWYEPAPGSAEAVLVHAAAEVSEVPPGEYGVEVVELPGIETVAALVHHGPMMQVDRSMQLLARWIEENGYRPAGAGYAREVYLDYDPGEPEKGVTELQIPVTRA